MKVAIYLRKSRGVDEDLEKHKEQLVSLCKSNNWSYDIYAEIGSSATLERPELSKMLDNIKKYNKVVVTALDRLSREELGQVIITQTLKENNIEVVTPNKIYNFNNENDVIMSDFEKLIARSEFRLIKKRLVSGKITGWKMGNWVQGKCVIPYMYDRDTKGLKVDPDKIDIWETIKDLALKGYSSYYIGEKTGLNALLIRRLLNNKTLLGYTKYQGKYTKGSHQAVLTQEEWNIIQNHIKGRTNGTTRTKHNYPLTSIVKCACGHSRSAVRRKDRGNKETIAKCRWCNDSSMLSPSIHKSILNEIKKYEVELLKNLNSNDSSKQLEKYQREKNIIEKSIVQNTKKLDKIKEMVLNDIIDVAEASDLTKNIKGSIKSLEESKNLIQSDIESINNISNEDTINNLRVVYKVLQNNLTDEELNQLYKTIIDKVVIKDKEVVEIVWRQLLYSVFLKQKLGNTYIYKLVYRAITRFPRLNFYIQFFKAFSIITISNISSYFYYFPSVYNKLMNILPIIFK